MVYVTANAAFASWQLRWRSSDGEEGVVPIPTHHPLVSLGRDPGCDIVVDHEWASNQHLEFVIEERGDVMVKDLGSTNKTFICPTDGPKKRAPVRELTPVQAFWVIQIADPVAVWLTLEPI